ncbi:uberolysin/carnocyclin family circular bacteriocin [[Clostridium] polysaccharolyticum]|uniref:Circular bacteriocin, circularin A/uberolysin family n=1 Tax=[Clostridium] polysaccharolyticum TaxID=29364 RepID=A0A1I0G2W2_9FIRM|nr:uberolysin/carnocyclin family circular bacteriocin [[Clostridium] polysaccharolyticum]SET64943.1 circular bacteriocin, circularin A/uberolysin family [[Clostridium] polysaccharolyticum]
MNKKCALAVGTMLIFSMMFGVSGVVAQLGVTTAAATKIIDIIDAGSTALTIISILGTVVGAGAVSYGFVVAAKAMIKKVGKKLAITW